MRSPACACFWRVQHSTLPAQLSRCIGREGACVLLQDLSSVALRERGGAVVEVCACVVARFDPATHPFRLELHARTHYYTHARALTYARVRAHVQTPAAEFTPHEKPPGEAQGAREYASGRRSSGGRGHRSPDLVEEVRGLAIALRTWDVYLAIENNDKQDNRHLAKFTWTAGFI